VALLLYDCCVEIVRKLGTVESNNITESRYLMRLILASLAAPPEESQTKLLLTFLKNKFKLAWLGKAKDNQRIENDDVLNIFLFIFESRMKTDNSCQLKYIKCIRFTLSRNIVSDITRERSLYSN
jgi:hypothetical protein